MTLVFHPHCGRFFIGLYVGTLQITLIMKHLCQFVLIGKKIKTKTEVFKI